MLHDIPEPITTAPRRMPGTIVLPGRSGSSCLA